MAAKGKRQGSARASIEAQLRLFGAPSPTRRGLRMAGLFAGIGGFELGFSRAGHETELLCEVEPGAQAVLRAHFPDIPLHDDITTLNRLPKGLDLVVGGFPCQDLSQAGKTAGITGARSGLVGHVFRLIQRERVPIVVLENVPFMLQLGRGQALEVILGELERLGYRWAYRVVDSRAFGLPQRRERVYFVATLEGDPREILLADDVGPPEEPANARELARGFYWTEGVRGLGWAVDAVPTLKGGSTIGIPSPPAIVLPSGEVVKPDIRDAERMQGFDVDWTAPTAAATRESHRWKLVGNAVSVTAAEWLGRKIASPGKYSPANDVELARGSAWPRAAWGSQEGRYRSFVSAWPERRPRVPLHRFLEFPPQPLSLKATAGFLARARSPECTLRFPEGFLADVDAHLERMKALPNAESRQAAKARARAAVARAART